MMDIHVFHKYNDLADHGITKSLDCQHCQQKLVTRINEDDEVYLWCAWCNISVHPGLDMYRRIQSVVKEHYLG